MLITEAAWADVRDKAKKIRAEGRVRIIAVADNVITAQVVGDSGTYETSVMRVPGTKQVGFWTCSCPWNLYAWARSGKWIKYEGRMCSHALAVTYEAQSQEFFGHDIIEQPGFVDEPDRPGEDKKMPGPWRKELMAAKVASTITVPALGYKESVTLQCPEGAEDRVMALQESITYGPSYVRAVMDSLRDMSDYMRTGSPEAALLALEAAEEIAQRQSVRRTGAAVKVDGSPTEVVDIVDESNVALMDGSVVPAATALYPTYDPVAGLVLPKEAAVNDDEYLFEPELPAPPPKTAGRGKLVPSEPTRVSMQRQVREAKRHPTDAPPASSREWVRSGSSADNSDIASAAQAHLAKTSMKTFSTAEQQAIIGEGVGVSAANLDRLDITGTHYEAVEALTTDDDFWL